MNFRISSTDYVDVAAMVVGSSPTFCCWIDFGCSIHRPLSRYVGLYIEVPEYVEFELEREIIQQKPGPEKMGQSGHYSGYKQTSLFRPWQFPVTPVCRRSHSNDDKGILCFDLK
jgi:hypothetical protein